MTFRVCGAAASQLTSAILHRLGLLDAVSHPLQLPFSSLQLSLSSRCWLSSWRLSCSPNPLDFSHWCPVRGALRGIHLLANRSLFAICKYKASLPVVPNFTVPRNTRALEFRFSSSKLENSWDSFCIPRLTVNSCHIAVIYLPCRGVFGKGIGHQTA